MTSEERNNLVAPCGIDCGICELYISKDNPKLYFALVEKGIPKERIPCPGCRSLEGNCPVLPTVCETYNCVAEKNINFCYECDEFPCTRLMPSADRAEVLPHNMKVFNLCTIQRTGVEAFTQVSVDIKKKYYAGKIIVGMGPLLNSKS